MHSEQDKHIQLHSHSLSVSRIAFGTTQTHTFAFTRTYTHTCVCIHTHACVCIANALAQVGALSDSTTLVLPAFANSYEDHPFLAMEFISAKNTATQPPTEAASLPRLTFPVLGEGWPQGVGDA